ncbi:acyltransferase [Planococcus sp. YIM B11945]|uniref:acyltransferase n=1 Tax=Planococcus sp. YIM B11945 TaxID=3435410 RepID=UPI003D7D96D7
MVIRYDYMDWLRVLSIFVVVGIHVVSKITSSVPPDEWAWQFANAIAVGLRWCVPVFFMLSGALLLTRKKEESIRTFLKKRLMKVVIPLLFWSFVYIAFNVFGKDASYTFMEMIQAILNDEVYFHLWFLYVIIGLYLMAPFLKILVHNMTQKTFFCFLAFWFLFSSVLPFLQKFWDMKVAVSPGLFESYIGYFMLGAYLMLYPIHRKWLPLLALLAVAGYFATLFGTEYLVGIDNKHDEFFYGYYRPNTLVIAIFIFVLFQNLSNRIKPNAFVTQLSTATLGIYLLHPLVQAYLYRIFGIHEMTIHPTVGVPLTWILIYSISYGIIYAVQKSSVLKKLVP